MIGSLLWDDSDVRKSWRSKRLKMEQREHVHAPIRYGRKSTSRGDTFTMVLDASTDPGVAVAVPIKQETGDSGGLLDEARAMWAAECKSHPSDKMSADWGCIGLLVRDPTAHPDLASGWVGAYEQENNVHPVTTSGELPIPWPRFRDSDRPLPYDFLLATSTVATSDHPTPADIAAAWTEQDGGLEEYFFSNVERSIRTAVDLQILEHIERQRPDWLDRCKTARRTLTAR